MQAPNPPLRRPASTASAARRYRPSEADIARLIDRARSHPLGLDFLRDGALDAVSMTFRVHAFTVERAREKLS